MLTKSINLTNRRVQQLLLYMRCLHLLSQTLDFSRAELKSKRLKPSTSVKTGEEISNLVEEYLQNLSTLENISLAKPFNARIAHKHFFFL